MPVCTNCAYSAQHVYTTYKTKSNIRLAVCPRCDEFQDPLIEHPDLILFLDLILLKPHVFLHLLFNRGSPPFDADKGGARSLARDPSVSASRSSSAGSQVDRSRAKRIHEEIIKYGLISILAETAVRLLPLLQLPSQSGAYITGSYTNLSFGICVGQIARTMGMVILEGLVQHLITLVLALLALRWKGWYPQFHISGRAYDLDGKPSGNGKKERGEEVVHTGEIDARVDGRRENFLPSLIPLTILYTSLLPLLLQLILSIWHVPRNPSPSPSPSSSLLSHLGSIHEIPMADSSDTSILSLIASILSSAFLPPRIQTSIPPNLQSGLQSFQLAISTSLDALRADKTYTWTWAGTRLLGGMSAGFGLRVLLPTQPWETTLIILAGWVGAALIPAYSGLV
ncbi:hypothetical protein I317_03504 [Kwoniella heveanensis CBS 569]|nr:hypothetical protein I317_03504 [Kwoniella heveanensis CBS 569]